MCWRGEGGTKEKTNKVFLGLQKRRCKLRTISSQHFSNMEAKKNQKALKGYEETSKHSFCFFWQKITEWEIQRNGRVCTTLMKAIQRHYTELVAELEEKQMKAQQRANKILEKLEQEISDLQTRTSELQQLEFTENPIHLIQVRTLGPGFCIFLNVALLLLSTCRLKTNWSFSRVSHHSVSSQPHRTGLKSQSSLITQCGHWRRPSISWPMFVRRPRSSCPWKVNKHQTI